MDNKSNIENAQRRVLSRMHLSPESGFSLSGLVDAVIDYCDPKTLTEALNNLSDAGRIAIEQYGTDAIVKLSKKERSSGAIEDPTLNQIRTEIAQMKERSEIRHQAMMPLIEKMVGSAKRKKPAKLVVKQRPAGPKNKKKGVIVIHPNGEKERVINLSAFCRERSLSHSSMQKILKGKVRSPHQGYRVEAADNEENGAPQQLGKTG